MKIYAVCVDEVGQRAATAMASIMPQLLAPTPRPPRGPYEVIAADPAGANPGWPLAPGDLVPTTAELATAHTVSIATARRAIALLRNEGLIDVSCGRRAVGDKDPAPV